MNDKLYQDTFSHVRSAYEFNIEDFEKTRGVRTGLVRRLVLIAAAVALLLALSVTAYATGFFGIVEQPPQDPPAPGDPPVTGEDVLFGAGVTLDPENIIEEQSFTVPLRVWGLVRFISYAPTDAFDDARFFLSYDSEVSDYEFRPTLTGMRFLEVAAVSFEDADGDGWADIILILDYETAEGEPTRLTRIFTSRSGGEFDIDRERTEAVNAAVAPEIMDIAAVREILGTSGARR